MENECLPLKLTRKGFVIFVVYPVVLLVCLVSLVVFFPVVVCLRMNKTKRFKQ